MSARRLNLLLLSITLLLVALVLYEPWVEPKPAKQGLLSLSAADVSAIAIYNGTQSALRLKRDPANRWRMIAPLEIGANGYKVETVLDILSQKPTNRFQSEQQRLADYGLQNPQVRLEMSGPNGVERLLFGGQTPLNYYRYLQLGDALASCQDSQRPAAQECAEVAIIDDTAFYPVASHYTNFITPKLLPEGAELSSIQLPDFQVQLQQGRWTFASANGQAEIDGGYSADQLAQWIDGWRHAGSVDIEPLKKQDEVIEAGEVVITLQSGDQLRWQISNSGDALTLGRGDLGIEYHMSSAQRDQLLRPPQTESGSGRDR